MLKRYPDFISPLKNLRKSFLKIKLLIIMIIISKAQIGKYIKFRYKHFLTSTILNLMPNAGNNL